ncbi:sulfite exporter TauE/SafE family protein [Oricola sp.]|uniref:sulfite exporter TauE/SafE family protein n=1 Tax=Oricola sp. TaxID=1979950 RepID=UPI0025F5A141|nr:sulfite exporter TauE/SafE family protein [Oricola sp.]MCI5075028.1 sulfite exporter TauE/SafE family protein [Oricola sp.]
MDVTFLLPDTIPASVAFGFVALSFFTSALTAAVGLGGGLVMLVVMGFFMPAAALIPVHGLVQFGSNFGRAWHLRRHVLLRAMAPFVIGAIFGAMLGGVVVVDLPDLVLKTALAAFVIILTWIKLPAFVNASSPYVFAIGGFVTTAASIFLGATGPLVAAFTSRAFDDRHNMVANFALAMTAQHLLKVVAFGALGFALAPWLPLAAAMIASGYLGTRAGAVVLDRTGEARFRITLKVGITLLALEMARRAWM